MEIEQIREQVRDFLKEHEYVYDESIFEELVHTVNELIQQGHAMKCDIFAEFGPVHDAMLIVRDRHPAEPQVLATRSDLDYERKLSDMRGSVVDTLLTWERDLTTDDFEGIVALAVKMKDAGDFEESPVLEAFDRYQDAHADRGVLLSVGKGDCYNEE